MSAILEDSMGDTITKRSVTWTSSDTTEADISASGLVTAKAPGHLTITASADSVFGSTALTVLVPVLTVRIGPTSAILVPGGGLRLSDTVVGTDGSILSDRLVSWSSDDSTVATVTDSGMVTGHRLGIDSIRASNEGITSFFPSAILVTQPSFVSLSTSSAAHHSCGMTATAVVFCWGHNHAGELGNGTFSTDNGFFGGLPFPTGMIILPGVTTVQPGGGFTCGIAYAVAYCWGDGGEYELGTGDLANRAAPARVRINAFALAISAGYNHACLLTTDSLAYCWGKSGGLGYPFAGSASPEPSAVSGGLRFVAVATGYHSTCGLGSDSLAYCWGDTPLAVPGGHKFLKLAHGYDHECGIATDSLAYCWGTNAFGQLGNGTTSVLEANPVAVSGALKLVSIAAGGEFTCGVATDGSGYCWGKNNTGQLGALTSQSCGGAACSMVPALVSGGFTWKQIVAGRYHVCGLSLPGVAYCWGLNDLGQVGDGTATSRTAPTRVAGQP